MLIFWARTRQGSSASRKKCSFRKAPLQARALPPVPPHPSPQNGSGRTGCGGLRTGRSQPVVPTVYRCPAASLAASPCRLHHLQQAPARNGSRRDRACSRNCKCSCCCHVSRISHSTTTSSTNTSSNSNHPTASHPRKPTHPTTATATTAPAAATVCTPSGGPTTIAAGHWP